jgi:hypothetical protein
MKRGSTKGHAMASVAHTGASQSPKGVDKPTASSAVPLSADQVPTAFQSRMERRMAEYGPAGGAGWTPLDLSKFK